MKRCMDLELSIKEQQTSEDLAEPPDAAVPEVHVLDGFFMSLFCLGQFALKSFDKLEIQNKALKVQRLQPMCVWRCR